MSVVHVHSLGRPVRGAALALLASGAFVVGAALPGSAAPAADPGGNNGVVKIQGADADTIQPDNNPHVGCTFDVEFYNYDEGDYHADVAFEVQSPTTGEVMVTGGESRVFIGADAASGGTDLDGRETYTLAFTGEPHDAQGYHVKVTVTAPDSRGNDTKTKVFWVAGCSTVTPTTSTTTTTTTTTSSTTSTTSSSTTSSSTTEPSETSGGTTSTVTGTASVTGTVPAVVQTDGPAGSVGSGLLATLGGALLVLLGGGWVLHGRRGGARSH